MSGGLMRPMDAPTETPTDAPHAFGGGQHGQQAAGTETSASVGEMNAVQRLLAGTNWTREDVDLALSLVSTLILLYWAYVEVQ